MKLSHTRTQKLIIVAALVITAIVFCNPAHALHPRYHTYETALAELIALDANYPEIARLDSIGCSSDLNYGIWALKISDNVEMDEDEPAVLFNGVHHAEEVLGLEICLYMAHDLCSRYGVDDTVTQWVNNTEIWLIPLLNPDGHKVVTESLDAGWRKNVRDNNHNGLFDLVCDGVDPNFNYDFCWSEGGSADSTSPYFRGPAPFSENETQIIRDICQQERFVFSLNYHSPSISSGDCIYYPWMWSGYFTPDHAVINNIANNVAQRVTCDTGPFYAVWGGATAGKARNWQYGVMGTIGMTIEVGSYEVQPPGAKVDTICRRNLPGAYYLIERVVGPGITGTVRDLVTGSPLEAEVRVLEAYDPSLPARNTDSTYGRFRRMLLPGTYAIEVLEEGYQTVHLDGVVVDDGPCVELDIALAPEGVSAEEIEPAEAPTLLLELSPNPFTKEATLRFRFTGPQSGTVDIFDTSGRLIRDFDLAGDAGYGSLVWDGLDSGGNPVPTGIYFARLTSGTKIATAKCVLLR
jgi:hypothetical protein